MQIAYYNIGLTNTQLSGEDPEIYREKLGKDCALAFASNDLGVLCLVEFGHNKLDESLNAHQGQNVKRWLEEAIQKFCTTCTDLEACVLGPYAIVLDKSVCCFETYPTLTDPLVACPDIDHTYRRAVHSVVKVLPDGPLIEVWVHHAPSSKERVYTLHAREQTMHYFFENVSNNGIVGGDLNMSKTG